MKQFFENLKSLTYEMLELSRNTSLSQSDVCDKYRDRDYNTLMCNLHDMKSEVIDCLESSVENVNLLLSKVASMSTVFSPLVIETLRNEAGEMILKKVQRDEVSVPCEEIITDKKFVICYLDAKKRFLDIAVDETISNYSVKSIVDSKLANLPTIITSVKSDILTFLVEVKIKLENYRRSLKSKIEGVERSAQETEYGNFTSEKNMYSFLKICFNETNAGTDISDAFLQLYSFIDNTIKNLAIIEEAYQLYIATENMVYTL